MQMTDGAAGGHARVMHTLLGTDCLMAAKSDGTARSSDGAEKV